MIECVNGNGQGSCALCSIIKGWHRSWSSSLYYVRNANGLFLRMDYGCANFSDDDELRKLAFCYEHAQIVDSEWREKPSYNKTEYDCR